MHFDGGEPIRVAIVNEAKTGLKVDLAALRDALHVQVSEHFGPVWGLPPVDIGIVDSIPDGCWGLVIMDDADQADALGYHDLTPAGFPIGKVFARTAAEDGSTVSIVASHELLEMLIDPAIQMCVERKPGEFWSYEVCDAVEGDVYSIEGVLVSNFVYPSWFEGFRKPESTKFDHLGLVKQPFELLGGGYISTWTVHKGWSEKFAGKPQHRRRHRTNRRYSGGKS